jgi:hypothetical protein
MFFFLFLVFVSPPYFFAVLCSIHWPGHGCVPFLILGRGAGLLYDYILLILELSIMVEEINLLQSPGPRCKLDMLRCIR